VEDEEEQIPSVDAVGQGFSDEQQDLIEHQQDAAEEQQFGNYPEPVPKDSIFTFFKHILKIPDSSKVANLDKRELGMLDLSVRNSEHLAHL
jgi:hypothetical protein